MRGQDRTEITTSWEDGPKPILATGQLELEKMQMAL